MYTGKSMESKGNAGVSGADKLRARQIAAIEEALKKVGPFGEVHLVVERGRIRFVRTIRSEPMDNSLDAQDKPSLPGD